MYILAGNWLIKINLSKYFLFPKQIFLNGNCKKVTRCKLKHRNMAMDKFSDNFPIHYYFQFNKKKPRIIRN
jgi:hypothetical protein